MSGIDMSAALTNQTTEEQLRAIHGDDLCHICRKPQRASGEMWCSYPHGRLPTKDMGGGMSAWEFPK